MSDPVYSQMIAVPGMKIAYHFQIAEGQMIAYEVAEDRTASLEDLRELFGRLDDAANYVKARRDLPFARLRLKQNREKLGKAEKALHDAIARQEAHIAHLSQTRRAQPEPMAVDINAVTQAQATLQGIIDTIRFDEEEIPRLEAIVTGREPPQETAEERPAGLSIVAAE
jgi:hypothetical protein